MSPNEKVAVLERKLLKDPQMPVIAYTLWLAFKYRILQSDVSMSEIVSWDEREMILRLKELGDIPHVVRRVFVNAMANAIVNQ